MSIDVERLLKWHTVWASTANDVLRDLDSVAAGHVVGYNVDYSVLFPYLWGRDNLPPVGAPQGEWDGVCRHVCLEMLRFAVPPGTKFIFTSASFIEAVESMRRHLDDTAHRQDEWHDDFLHLRRELEEVERSLGDVVKDDLMTRRQLEDRLDNLSRRVGYRTPDALRKLRTFVAAGGPLVGLRDLAPKLDLKKYDGRFNELFDEMERTRGQSKRETRSPDVRRLHYKIDCANIVLCEAITNLESDTELGFVTKASNKKHLVRNLGRTSLMVLVLLRSNRLNEFPDSDSRKHYMQWMAHDAERIAFELRRRQSIEEGRDSFLLSALEDFNQRFVAPMYGRRPEATSSVEEKLSGMKLVASSKDRFREHLAMSRETMNVGLTKVLDEHANILDDELLTTFEIDAEPRAKAVLAPASSRSTTSR